VKSGLALNSAKPFLKYCKQKRSLLSSGFVELVSLDKAVYPSFGVNNLLLTSIERMAAGADFNTNLLFGGTHLYRSAAYAGGDYFIVLGVNSFLHLAPDLNI
jgi:hypothetical protein